MTEAEARVILEPYLKAVKRAAPYANTASFHRERFASEYVVDLDARAASLRCGLCRTVGYVELRNPETRALIEKKMREREQVSELKGEYVRQYLLDVLELCPTEHFLLAPDGSWCIDPEAFNQLPNRIKRLVQNVTLKVVAGRSVVSVEFVSKQAALAMAAKYTLTQHIEATVTSVPWDEVARRAERAGKVLVEDKLRILEHSLEGRNGGTNGDHPHAGPGPAAAEPGVDGGD